MTANTSPETIDVPAARAEVTAADQACEAARAALAAAEQDLDQARAALLWAELEERRAAYRASR